MTPTPRTDAGTTAERASVDRAPGPTLRFCLAGLVAGACAITPRYAGPHLDTADRVEVADHVVPGALVVLVSVAVLACGLVRARRSPPMLPAGLAVVLAGCWMTATHVPLLAQAARDEVGWGAGLFHTLPGVAVLALGLVWAGSFWAVTPEERNGQAAGAPPSPD